MRHIKSIIILHFFVLSSIFLKAGVETVNSRISGNLIVNYASVFIQDINYPNVELSGTAKVAAATGKVIFSIDNASNLYFSSSNTVIVGLKIYSYDKNGVAQSLPSIVELEVGYSPSGIYKDKNVYVVNGSHKITAVIQYIKDGAGVPIPPASVPQNLSLEVEQSSERYYSFNTAVAPTSVGSTFLSASNELDIHWNVTPGAEEYELEWSYVNNYDVTGSALAASSVMVNFRGNSTRIRLSQTHYPISLLFDQGYVVYRVRAIGKPFTDLSKEVYGIWSAPESGTVSPDYSTVNYLINSADRHERTKNWQYSASYAEEGKKKEVVSYFDGSLRNRQSVTKLNTDKKTIVGETIYDHQGRGAIQVLPTPTSQSVIKFYPDFNKSLSAGTPAYSRLDFDKDNIGSSCVAPTFGMSNTSGSSYYYSSSNTDKSGFQSYVPDANLYPFSQVEFTPDNTGRIRRQSGVGADHMLGTSHETQYFYGQPEQIQLDRMFGSEVGSFKHYKKNMVIDANGQISVSYLDMHGRTIATSLAGNSPTNLTPLTATATEFTIDYLKAGDPLVPNSNEYLDNALIFSKDLTVATAGDYDFYYDLEVPKFNDTCLPSPICYDCIYDLEISVKDACGTPMMTTVSQTIGTIDTTCGASNITFTVTPSPVTAYLPVGSYKIYKKLKINEAAIDFYTENFINNNTCITPYSTFLTNALAEVDTNACDISCDECVTSLGLYTSHNDSTKSDFVNFPATYDPDYVFYTISEWKRAISDCNAPCTPNNLCQAQYQTLLSDVSPSGQYGKFNISPTGVVTVTDVLSVYNTTNILPDRPNADWRHPKLSITNYATSTTTVYNEYRETDGSRSKIYVTVLPDGSYYPAVDNNSNVYTASLPYYFYPEHFANLIDFIDAFGNHPEWAKSLVEYHPEYAYYEWCIKNNTSEYSHTGSGSSSLTSDAFDDLLRSTDTYSDAVTLFSLSSTGITDLLNQDPYFSSTASPNAGQGSGQQTFLSSLLGNYNASGKNLKELCAIASRCGTVYYGAPAPSCDDFGSGSGAAIKNKEWVLYRNMYLAEKQKLQQNLANAFAIVTYNYNGCIGIGTDPYNPWYAGPFTWTSLTTNHDPCGYITWFLYKDKVKRFQNAGDAMGGVDPFGDQQDGLNTLVNNEEYNMYLQTGNCPVTSDLGFLLDNLAQNSQLVSTGVNLVSNGLFTQHLYDAIIAPSDPSATTFINYYWTSSVGTGNTLNVTFKENSSGGTADGCQLNLVLPTGNSWSDVVRMSNIHFTNESPTGTYNFTITAFVDTNPTDATPAVQVTVTGSTCINLHPCTFPDNCGPSETAVDIQNLFNALISNTQFVSTGSGINIMAAPYDSFVPNIIGGTTYTNLIWNFNSGTNYGTIGITGTDYCGFTFTFVNTGYTMSNVNYFAHIRPDPTDPTHKFDIDAWVGTGATAHFETIHVYNASGCYNYQVCTPPPNLECSGPEYINNDVFLATLNTLASQGQLLVSNNLTRFPAFAALFNITALDSSLWGFSSVDTTTQIYTASLSGPQISDCSIELQFSDIANSHSYSDIVGFSNFQVSTTGSHNFTVLARFSDGTSLPLNGSIECLTFSACQQCNQTVSVSTVMTCNFDGFNSASPGFTSTRTYSPSPTCTLNNSTFVIGGPGYCTTTIQDHNNPGVGNFFACHSDASTNYILWDKTVSVSANKYYKFTYWVLRGDAINPPYTPIWSGSDLQTSIAGTLTNFYGPTVQTVWTEISQIWYSGAATSVNLKIIFNAYVGTIGLDDIKFEEVQLLPCNPIPADPSTIPVLPYVNPCVQNLIDLATSNAQYAYNSYIQDVMEDFREDYLETCKNALENFKMVYTDKEHHITLYYYDQAGNLIKTVPPEGVVLVTSSADLTQIATDRLNKTQTYVTKHALETHYEYNSLNQLIRQATPDNALMDKWLLNGVSVIPASTSIYGMAFSSGNNGFVVGNNGSGVGVIYITSDGGSTWSLVSSLGLDDLEDVQFIGLTGYAISEEGYLVKSTDGGTTWTTISTTGTTQKLNDLYFSSSTNGIIIGDNGTILYTTDGGTTWTSSTVPSLYSSVHFKDLHFISSTNGFLAGSSATSLRTTDGGVTWSVLPGMASAISTLIKFNAVHFANANEGYFAGVNTITNVGFIAKANLTTGTWSFTTLSPAATGVEFKTITAITPTDIYAGGTNGKLYKSTNGINFTLQTITPPSGSFTSEITELIFPNSSFPLQGYATARNGQFLKSNTTGGSWTSSNITITGSPVSIAPLNGLYFDPATPTTGYVAGDGGTLFKTIDGGTTWTSLTNVLLPVLNDAGFANGSTIVAYAVGDGGSIIKSTDGGASWLPVISGSIERLNSVAFHDVNNGFAVGENGTILKITGGGSLVLPSVSGTIAHLHDVARLATGTNYYIVVGNSGTVLKTTDFSSWVPFTSSSSTTANLNAVYFVGDIGYAAGNSGTIIKTTNGGTSWTTLTLPGAVSTATFRDIYFRDNLVGYAMGDAGVIIKTVDGGDNWTVETGTNSGNFYTSSFSVNGQALIAGTTAGGSTTNLSTLNDESSDFSSRFWYDRLGRLIVSQNVKQFNKTPVAYSYTKYDALGRIIEVGETASSTDIETLATNHGVIADDAGYSSWLSAGNHSEITTTLYDEPISTAIAGFTQENLRSRVSATYLDHDGIIANGYDQASVYSYDIHGNVKTLIQENAALAITNPSQRYKRLEYEYDLVSGKVNQVSYQPGEADQLYHKYEYDADNRITNVITSNDGAIWSNDANYFYYNHGPLARVEIGDQKVQALDYVYTIQGWLKGVNSNTLVETRDPGKDGTTGTLYSGLPTDIHSKIGRDSYGYSLSYYDAVASVNGNDYTKINTNSAYNTTNDFIADASLSPGYMTDAPNLFNGNIKRMVTTITDIDPVSPTTGQALPQLTAYRYDQLNRIVQLKAYNDMSGNAFTGGSTYLYNGSAVTYNDPYKSTMTYDANGNILTMSANGHSGAPAMDAMDYQYDINTATGKKRSNKLYMVDDISSTYSTDISDQGTFVPAVPNNLGLVNTANNYGYDEIGNLVRDNQEHISNIEWTVYGKIKKITFVPGFGKNDISYDYDASGNRIAKHCNNIDTYYVRDAQGNVISVYEQKMITRGTGGYTGPDYLAFKLIEQDIYGSSRLGLDNRNKLLCKNNVLEPADDPSYFERNLGKKNYELSNHLGNVLTTVSDRKLAFSTGGVTIDYYKGEILSVQDYYSFGAPMPGRGYTSATGYRYGFNGKEKDPETVSTGEGTQDYGLRIYNPSLGRFLSVDPLSNEFPWNSTYAFAENDVIRCIDLEGAEKKVLIYHWSGTDYTLAYIGPPTSDEELQKVSKKVVLSTGLNPDGTLVLFSKDIKINAHSNPDETAQSSATITYDYQYIAKNASGELEDRRGETDYTTKETEAIGLNPIKDAKAAYGAYKDLTKPRFNNRVPLGKQANHIFQTGKKDKFEDTSDNRTYLESFTKGDNYAGKDKHGKEWHYKTLEDGTQHYAYTQDGVVKGAGINDKPVDVSTLNLEK